MSNANLALLTVWVDSQRNNYLSAAGEVGIWSEHSTEANCPETDPACNAGDLGLIPGLGRSPGGGHGNPLQYSYLENPHGQRRLGGYSHGVAKSRSLTVLLPCLDTALTVSFGLLTSSRKTSSTIGKIGGTLRLLSPEGIWPTKFHV